MVTKYVSYGIIGAGLALLAFSILPALGNVGSGDPNAIVCDMTGSISGRVRDYNLGVKDVINLNTMLSPTNCHPRTIFDFSFFPDATVPRGALIGEGSVTIYVKVFDASNELVKDKTFEVKTAFGETEKNFNEALLFKGLEKGKTYTLKVYHSWTGEQVAHTKTFTV